LIKGLNAHVLALDVPRAFLDKVPNEAQEKLIREGIERIVNHPIWTTNLESTAKTKAVREAFLQNQDASTAFGDVGLKLGYAVGADPLPNNWMN
jgi:hypothetical protein